MLAVSDIVWQALIAGVVAVILGWLQVRTRDVVQKGIADAAAGDEVRAQKIDEVAAKLERSTAIATAKTDEVAAKLQDSTTATTAKIEENTAITKVIHSLVNNAMTVALSSVAELQRWKATQTKTMQDADLADKAERALAEHKAKQGAMEP